MKMISPAQRLTRRLSWLALKARLQRSDLPVLAGPFRGEVGFEALYWVPFLRKLGLGDRLIPVTRGGAACWYPHSRSVELYSLRTPKQVRVENFEQVMRTGMLKPMRWSRFDREVIEDAAMRLGIGSSYLALHPKWMYRTLEPYWEQQLGLLDLARDLDIQTYPLPVVDGLTLPEHFVAVRFYFRPTFPASETTVTVAKEAVKQIALRHPVIVLNSGIHADDHEDCPLKGPNVTQLSDYVQVTPENNLAVLSAILAKSMGFVGTYGGLSQLALLYKKPSVSFYTDWKGTALPHKHFADAIATQLGVSTVVLKVTEVPMLHTVLPQVTFASSSGTRQAVVA